MKKIFAYLPLHFLVLLVVGILFQFYLKIWTFSFVAIPFFILFLLIVFIFSKKILRTLIGLILFFFLGIFLVFIQNDTNYPNHYVKHLENDSLAVVKIRKILKENQYNRKYEAEVIQLGDVLTKGKVLVNISKEDTINALFVDDLLVLKADFKAINVPYNPYQFNYKLYLQKQGISQQLFLKNNQYKHLKPINNSWLGYANLFRNKIQRSLEKFNFKPNELAVINALLLGNRENISKQLLEDYANAGAIHILAVSGLHVGIILLLLSTLLKPLEQLKNGKFLKTVIVVLSLWVFAFIAGLSASVIRAVTMFTFVAIGLFFNRNNIVLFSLISSLFFLLIFNPLFLFDVGFQLSYLAVFGIVILQPKMYSIWQPNYKIMDKFWQLATVSLAAQIGVLPLSLYYFHQFPGLFMLSNLIIVPLLGFILIGGIVVIILALLNVLPQFLADFYGLIISLMNNFVSWISKQEDFLFTEISLSFQAMFAIYLVIAFGIYFFIHQKTKSLVYFLFTVLLLQGIILFENYQTKTKNEFIIFHKSRHTVLGERVGGVLKIKHDISHENIQHENAILSYTINQKIDSIIFDSLPSILQFNKKKLLIVDDLGVYNIPNLKHSIVLLSSSPKINLERLIKVLTPELIIADGSNYKSYVRDWELIASKRKIPFYNTNKKGAFIFNN
ncbi:ComEC/Rec2 family competence protein [Polaribacter sp.]|uniref:ComEC/Rec2 family competence protein n=1 Tax=Polaribacter sp. TaxID=1920175 RepID=UPI003F6989AC